MSSNEINLDQLLDSLDFSEESLGRATLQQGSLYRQAATYYVAKMRERMEAENAYDDKRTGLAQAVRRSEWEKRSQEKPRRKELTEGELDEKLFRYPALRQLKKQLDECKAGEEFAKQLLKAFEWRGKACQILAGVLDEESRSDLRVLTAERAKQNLMGAVDKKWKKR